jgi:hypothetical protein
VNEELKIIISAATKPAQDGINKVKQELQGLQGTAGKTGGAMKGMGAKFAAAATVAVAAIGAIVAAVSALSMALVKLSTSTKEYRQEQAKLNAAFLSAGSTAEQATETYNNLYRFLGDSSKAAETAQALARITPDKQALKEWTTSLQGIYAMYGDDLAIEQMASVLSETVATGEATGDVVRVLEEARVNVDEFNAKLAQTTSIEEREAITRGVLNSITADAARIYEELNKELIENNEAQARLDATMGRLGTVATPLATAFINLSNAILTALGPAIEWLSKALTVVINALTRAVQWVSAFIGILGGSTKAVIGTQQIAKSVNSASTGAKDFNKNLKDANTNAEKLKKTTAGFDELNVISSGSTGSNSKDDDDGNKSGQQLPFGDFALDTALEKTATKATEFGEKIKGVFSDLKTKVGEWAQLFNPSIEAWKTAFSGLGEPLALSFESVKASIGTLWTETLSPFTGYIMEQFVPNITNSFSENFAPMFADLAETALPEFAKDFEWMCQQIDNAVNDIITPALKTLETITTDTFDIIGDEWEQSGKDLTDGLIGVKESVKKIWDDLYNKILKPVWDSIVGAIQEMWEKHLKDLVAEVLSFASKVGTAVSTVWNNFLGPIVQWIITVLAPSVVGAIDSILAVVDTIIGIVSGVVKGVLKSLGGLMDFITGVFSGNWKLAWSGIKNFFKGIFDGLWSIAKGIINLIIDGINGLWSGIYNVIRGLVNGIGSIAGAIGDLLGKDWSFSMPNKPPKIPKLATGGIVNSATVAMIGERGKEAVLPLENNTDWMDKLADRIASRNSGPSKIVLMLNEKELGWANIKSINAITQQTGTLQLSLV